MKRRSLYHLDVGSWLATELGLSVLEPMTETDWRALLAAVQIVELWRDGRQPHVAQAFKLVVIEMHQHLRRLAYHAIAHVMDWSHREELWRSAGLPEVTHTYGRCRNEPG